MMQILKRLEIIKSSIAIEDDEIVEMQITKLKQNANETVQRIISLLENRDYPQAIETIEAFIKQQTALSVYIDPELSALKLQLKKLEEELTQKEAEKADVIHEIEEFNHAYHRALGKLIEAILKAKLKLAKNKKEISVDILELENDYQEARREYEEFHRDYESLIKENREELDEDSMIELKKTYREAAKLCHPDMVADNKEAAEEIFKELNNAYEKNDLKKVKEILAKLKNGEVFGLASDAIDDKELLRRKIEIIKELLTKLDGETRMIKTNETYLLVQEIKNREAYFENLKIQLQKELAQLLNDIEDIKEDADAKSN